MGNREYGPVGKDAQHPLNSLDQMILKEGFHLAECYSLQNNTLKSAWEQK